MTIAAQPLSGIYAAAITPLKQDGRPDLDALPGFLSFLAERGCHGALLLGTTGEGTSFDRNERRAIWEAAARVLEAHPEFKLLAGTGTPSLTETVELNRIAFDLGYDAVVVLPPFYDRSVLDAGLLDWYSRVMEASVPQDKWMLGYHIPAVSGVGLSVDLLAELNRKYPGRFGGLKDSSGDLPHARSLVSSLGGKSVLVGNDKLLAAALASGASGCITALANLISPQLHAIWDAHLEGSDTEALQSRVSAVREVLDSFPPAPAFLKAMLHELYDFPDWVVRPPLLDFDEERRAGALSAVDSLL